MARDQFQRVQPGAMLPGLPSQPWNAMLDLTKPRGLGPIAGGGRADWPDEFRVVNTTGSAVAEFGILQVDAPLNLQSAAPDNFYAETILKGVAPATDKPFVVFQEPVSAGGVGLARILGVTKCLVSIGTSGDRYAAPTTSTTTLTSQATPGPATILHPTSGTGTQWATVLLTGQAAAAAGGPTVLATPNGGATINTTSNAANGTLFTQSAFTGKGLYWWYQTAQALVRAATATEEIVVSVNWVPAAPTSGQTYYEMSAAVYVTAALGTAGGGVGLSALIEVASPAAGTPSVALNYGILTNGFSSKTGSVSTSGFVVLLRDDS